MNIKITNYHATLILSAFVLLALSLPLFVSATQHTQVITPPGGTPLPIRTSGGGQTIEIPNPLQARTFEDLVSALNRWLLVIAVPILTLMIFIGAFQIMTGAGNPEKITQGRHTITYAIIGYALLLISSGITFIIKEVLGTR
jgi:hypothetical protein